MKKDKWPKDSWQCPFCSYHASSLESLVKHFRDVNQQGGNHSYKYLRARFRIEPVKRLNIKVQNYTGDNEISSYDASKDPINYRMKPVPFESNRRKH